MCLRLWDSVQVNLFVLVGIYPMNGLFWFVTTICLIGLGFLFGWSVAEWTGKDTWSAIGAIGSWFGGFGAVYAAFVALQIANRQSNEDTYKLKIETIFSDNLLILRELETSDDEFLHGDFNGKLILQAYNSGRRPIELVRLIYKSKISSGYIEFTEFLVPPGSRRKLEVMPSGFVDFGHISKSLNIGFLFACDLSVEDAAGVIHQINGFS